MPPPRPCICGPSRLDSGLLSRLGGEAHTVESPTPAAQRTWLPCETPHRASPPAPARRAWWSCFLAGWSLYCPAAHLLLGTGTEMGVSLTFVFFSSSGLGSLTVRLCSQGPSPVPPGPCALRMAHAYSSELLEAVTVLARPTLQHPGPGLQAHHDHGKQCL